MKLDKIKFDELYVKARVAYSECAAADPDVFINELGAPFESISTKDASVGVTFDGTDPDHYLLETKLELVSDGGVSIGWYCLHEEESGEVVDDFLVFE